MPYGLSSHTTQASWSDDDFNYSNDQKHHTKFDQDDQDDQGHNPPTCRRRGPRARRKPRKPRKPKNQRNSRKPKPSEPPPEDGHTGEFLMPMFSTDRHHPIVCFHEELLPFQNIQAHLTRLHDVSRTLKEEEDSLAPVYKAAAQSVAEASKHVADAIHYLKGRKKLRHTVLRQDYYDYYTYHGRSPTIDICPPEWKTWPDMPPVPPLVSD